MDEGHKKAVYLRVYDLSDGAARTWSPVLLGKRIEGIWHTGILLSGMEYFYGELEGGRASFRFGRANRERKFDS